MPTERTPAPRRVWIDIDNPPQVQYLTPFADAFVQRGSEVLVTARDHGIAHDLLRGRGVSFIPVGSHAGSSKIAKVAAVLRRALALTHRVGPWEPDVALFATRSAALAAPLLGIPGFALVDYEFIDLRAFRLARSYVVHPSVVGRPLRQRRVNQRRLVPYDGIKEDITFAHVDLGRVEPHPFPELDDGRPIRVLVRPPDERSHYYSKASGHLAAELFTVLAAREDVAVILSPRYPEQAGLLTAFSWQRTPVILRTAVPFVRLLAAVDVVVTGGGTMAREAAYMGVPSYSVFGGELGAVDRFLEQQGRLTVLRTTAEMTALRLERRARALPLASNPRALDDIVDEVSALVARH